MKLTLSSSNKTRKNKDKTVLKKRINKMAIPLLFSHITHILYGFGDQAIIGHTSLQEYAGVSLVANILFMLTGSIGIVSVALNILGSRLIDQKDKSAYAKLFNTTLTFTVCIGLTFSILALIFGHATLEYVFNLNGSILEAAYQYLIIASLGLMLNIVLFNFSAYLKSKENTKVIFYGTIFSSAINLVIDYILVFGKFGMPELGVAGAAIGTVIGLTLNVIIYLYVFYRNKPFHIGLQFDLCTFKQLMQSYLPLLGQDMVESTIFTILVMMIVSRISPLAVGVYGLVTIITHWVTLPIYSYCNAGITLFSKLYKDKNGHQIKMTVHLLLTLILRLIVLLSFIIYCFRRQFVGLITDDIQLLNGVTSILYMPLVFRFLNIPSQVYKHLLNAVDLSNWVFRATVLVNIVSLVLIYSLAVVFKLDLLGVFIGFACAYALNSVLCFRKYTQAITLLN